MQTANSKITFCSLPFAICLSSSGRRDLNPRPTAWKAVTLPPELLPLFPFPLPPLHCRPQHIKALLQTVGREGFEPPKAKPADLQSAPFGHSGTSPANNKKQTKKSKEQLFFFLPFAVCYSSGATSRNRTRDPLITSEVLYQLSYGGPIKAKNVKLL
jgi:hypothetical protein